MNSKLCPECGHVFQGNGWDGIDAHWKAKHGKVMPYAEAWPLIKAGTYTTRTDRPGSVTYQGAPVKVSAQLTAMSVEDARKVLSGFAGKKAPGVRKAPEAPQSQSERFIAKAREEESASMDAEGLKIAADGKAQAELHRTQSEKFIDMARELGLDEREEAFDAALSKVSRPDKKRL